MQDVGWRDALTDCPQHGYNLRHRRGTPNALQFNSRREDSGRRSLLFGRAVPLNQQVVLHLRGGGPEFSKPDDGSEEVKSPAPGDALEHLKKKGVRFQDPEREVESPDDEGATAVPTPASLPSQGSSTPQAGRPGSGDHRPNNRHFNSVPQHLPTSPTRKAKRELKRGQRRVAKLAPHSRFPRADQEAILVEQTFGHGTAEPTASRTFDGEFDEGDHVAGGARIKPNDGEDPCILTSDRRCLFPDPSPLPMRAPSVGSYEYSTFVRKQAKQRRRDERPSEVTHGKKAASVLQFNGPAFERHNSDEEAPASEPQAFEFDLASAIESDDESAEFIENIVAPGSSQRPARHLPYDGGVQVEQLPPPVPFNSLAIQPLPSVPDNLLEPQAPQLVEASSHEQRSPPPVPPRPRPRTTSIQDKRQFQEWEADKPKVRRRSVTSEAEENVKPTESLAAAEPPLTPTLAKRSPFIGDPGHANPLVRDFAQRRRSISFKGENKKVEEPEDPSTAWMTAGQKKQVELQRRAEREAWRRIKAQREAEIPAPEEDEDDVDTDAIDLALSDYTNPIHIHPKYWDEDDGERVEILIKISRLPRNQGKFFPDLGWYKDDDISMSSGESSDASSEDNNEGDASEEEESVAKEAKEIQEGIKRIKALVTSARRTEALRATNADEEGDGASTPTVENPRPNFSPALSSSGQQLDRIMNSYRNGPQPQGQRRVRPGERALLLSAKSGFEDLTLIYIRSFSKDEKLGQNVEFVKTVVGPEGLYGYGFECDDLERPGYRIAFATHTTQHAMMQSARRLQLTHDPEGRLYEVRVGRHAPSSQRSPKQVRDVYRQMAKIKAELRQAASVLPIPPKSPSRSKLKIDIPPDTGMQPASQDDLDAVPLAGPSTAEDDAKSPLDTTSPKRGPPMEELQQTDDPEAVADEAPDFENPDWGNPLQHMVSEAENIQSPLGATTNQPRSIDKGKGRASLPTINEDKENDPGPRVIDIYNSMYRNSKDWEPRLGSGPAWEAYKKKLYRVMEGEQWRDVFPPRPKRDSGAGEVLRPLESLIRAIEMKNPESEGKNKHLSRFIAEQAEKEGLTEEDIVMRALEESKRTKEEEDLRRALEESGRGTTGCQEESSSAALRRGESVAGRSTMQDDELSVGMSADGFNRATAEQTIAESILRLEERKNVDDSRERVEAEVD